jgi:Flp pilus assembly protein TadG
MSQNATPSFFNRFSQAKSGIAALEFALIAPMMFMLLFVSFELVDAVAANGRAERAAGSIADVISRDVLVSDAEVADVLAAVPWITHPTPGESVRARITSVFVDASGRATVVWSEGSGMPGLAPGSVYELPDGMRIPETGLVVGETQVDYRPPLGLYSAAAFTINKVEVRRSRVMDPVERFAG